jgi:hypothetical protein
MLALIASQHGTRKNHQNQIWSSKEREEGPKKMGDENLSMFQSAHLRWLKRQVDNLQDLRYTRHAPKDLDVQLFVAREELDNFVNELRKADISI